MIWFWRFLLGYLTIKINGENAEQILNRAAANGIDIWNLRYKNGVIYGNITLRDFLKMRKIKRKVKCKIKIIKKYGLVFFLKKHKARTGFVLGGVIFIITLMFLSNFVWIINVEGNKSIPTKEIILSCKKIGIYEGVKKSKINNKYDSQRLQLTQKGLAWCSLNLEGSVLTVNVSEAVTSNTDERETPTNLKACIDGKIKKIDVSSGNVTIKVGDVVSKGDLLVSGVVSNMSSTVFVHSKGEIIAETSRTFTAYGDYKQNKTIETEKTKTRYTINCFNLVIPLYLGNIKPFYNYEITVKNATLFTNKIPIKLACEKYIFTKKAIINYKKSDLEKILYNDIKEQVNKFKFLSATEGDREAVYTDKGILLKITYNCLENIAVQDNIILNKEN